MINAMSIAVSGMSAASAQFTAAASRLVGAMTNASSPPASSSAGQTTTGSPSGPLKGSLIAFGNSLDPVNDIASEITASLVYKANLKSFEVASMMMKSTLDILA
jgi:flagellar basal body rod protein FlgC